MQINIEKRHVFLILSVLVLLSGVILASSYTFIPNPGHGGDRVQVTLGGQEMTLQEAIDQGKLITSSYNLTNCEWTSWIGRCPGTESIRYCSENKIVSGIQIEDIEEDVCSIKIYCCNIS